MFPPKVKLIKFQDYVNGQVVERETRQVSEGWLTRPWQQEIIEAPGLKKVVRVSRRAGKTALSIVKCLHKSFVEGRGVLVIAPMERQVAEIYNTMHKQFINTKPEVFTKTVLTKDTRSPYVMQFSNGGFINFITAGTKSGAKGEAVRGQGHGVGLIYIDEADYLSDDDLDAILAIQIQDPSIEVILTSTPTGKRNKFYELCTSPPPGWRAFHKTAPEAIPEWNEFLEDQMKRQYGIDAYNREFMAEFGEEVTGVFNKDRIEEAMERGKELFPYTDSEGNKISTKLPYFGYAQEAGKDPSSYRFVGVDWDKYGAGTQIVVVEAQRHQVNKLDAYARATEQPFDYIKVLHRTEIPKSKFTLTVAVNTLIDINRRFDPDYYYLDAGYGEHQIETLQRAGIECKDPEDPAFGIHKKIIRLNFSQQVEVMDPITKQIIKRPVKPVMVGRLVNKFDEGEMILNPFDDVLQKQLENYCVEKITDAGQPKYTSINEHAVDALMLAVYGLYEKYGVKAKASFNKAIIEKPIGERYAEQMKLMQQAQAKKPDYLKGRIVDEVDKENLDEELTLQRQGLYRPQQIKTSTGIPERRRASNDQNTFINRGGTWTSTRGRKF